MRNYILNIFKGALMGAANVIPGVSGGTMALLTGIFERLINAIKSFDLHAVKLASKFQLKELCRHIDLPFLSAIGIGVLASILTVAHLLKYLFAHHALYVWSFFFGLILASVFFVTKMIKRMNGIAIVLFIFGTAIAASIAFIDRASENDSILYLMLCGAIAMCSMILPGLSGSFILILLGNYNLIMIESITAFNLKVLIPVGIGAIAGLASFANLLSWIFRKFHDQTVSLLAGFIFGSLAILWPWKTPVMKTFQRGEEIKEKIVDYTNYTLPELSIETGIAVAIMVAGIAAIAGVETAANKMKSD